MNHDFPEAVAAPTGEASSPQESVSEPLISVVVATHRRPERCARLLRALALQTIGPDAFEVMAIDDCSGDSTGEVLASLVDEVPYRLRPMRTEANRGPGPARNLGWRAAVAPYVAFTDDDCVPDRGWLAAGLAALRADPDLGLVQGRTDPADRQGLLSSRWNHAIDISTPDPYFQTCNIFYRREALDDGGGFGEHYNWWGGWYCEDTICGWRTVDAGWQRGFTAEARVVHDLEARSMRWWINKSLVLSNEVEVAVHHPGFRAEAFWRPWAPRRHDAAFVLGSFGLLVATRWRPAALLTLPYVWWRRPSVRQPQFVRRCVETVGVDAARTAGILYGAMRHRTLVI